jgi:hypothetical protein
MATLASWYEDELESGTPGSSATGWERTACDPNKVRAFPGEDVCLWVKNIDNSRVVREADPRLLEACWRFITVASLVVIAVVGLLLPNAYGMLAGYRLHQLEKEQTALLREQNALELEESRLLSPKRLEELASMQEYLDPAPGNVVYLDPRPEGTLAMNRAAQGIASKNSAAPAPVAPATPATAKPQSDPQ